MEKLELEIRKHSTEELLGQLRENQEHFDVFGVVVLCDELIQRRMPVQYLSIRYEKLIKSLSKSELKYIDLFDARFTKATLLVVENELEKRGIKRLEWFYSKDGSESQGPVFRTRLYQLIKEGEIAGDHLIWKEGMDEWVPLSNLEYLTNKLFFDQEFDGKETLEIGPGNTPSLEREEQARPTDKNQTSSVPSKGSNTVTGVLELLTLPFWVLSWIFVLYEAWGTDLGALIPLLFALFSTLAVIPLGIGLLMYKKWAWSMKITLACITIFLIILQYNFNGANIIWILFAGYQALMIYLLVNDKLAYRQ